MALKSRTPAALAAWLENMSNTLTSVAAEIAAAREDSENAGDLPYPDDLELLATELDDRARDLWGAA